MTQPLDRVASESSLSLPFWRTPFSRRSLYAHQQLLLLFRSEVRSFLVFKSVSSRAEFCHRDTLFATGITVTSFRDPSPYFGRFQVFLLRLEQGGTTSADPYDRLGSLSWSQFPLILDF